MSGIFTHDLFGGSPGLGGTVARPVARAIPAAPSYPHCNTPACVNQAYALAQSAMALTRTNGDDGMRVFQFYYRFLRGAY